MQVPEDFIQAHIKQCHIDEPKKRAYGQTSKYYGKRKFYTINISQRKRQCAKKLYKSCIELGIKPTPNTAKFQQEYDKAKGIKK